MSGVAGRVCVWLLVAGMVGFCPVRGWAAQLSVSGQPGSPGATLVIPVVFSAQSDSISGIQFDLQYENSIMSITATPGGSSQGKSLYYADVAANRKRFVLTAPNRDLLVDGTVVNLNVSIKAAAPAGPYQLTASNVIGTDPSGNPASINAASGKVTLTGSTFQLVNAASLLAGAVTPGEIISIFGSGLGPSVAQVPSGTATSTNLGGSNLWFDGTPAPLLYAGANQVNAIVPYAVFGKSTTQFEIRNGSQVLGASTFGVAGSAPAIFSVNASGSGPGAILNQDGSVNSASNPAARGSIIALYATGGGQTTPEGIDGQVTGETLPKPLLPVSVQVGGFDAEVLYGGAAPALVSGALQVNCRIPANVAPGSSVDVILKVGSASSPTGLTVAVR
jgi:uncharacterized protein (TIGR03437 family)